MNQNLYKLMLGDNEFKGKRERPYIHILKHNGKLYSVPLLSKQSSGYPSLSMPVKSKENDAIGYLDFSKSFEILNDKLFTKSSIAIEVDEKESAKYFAILYEIRKKTTSKMVNQTKALNIQRNLYLKEYLKNNGLPLNKKFICRSKNHNDKEASMQYNFKNNTVHCFSCGVTYDLISIIKNDYDLNYKQSLAVIDNLIKSDFKDTIIDLDHSQNIEKISEVALKRKLDYIEKCKANVDKTNYFSARGINKEIYSKIAGYDEKSNRVIFVTRYPENSYIYKNLNTNQKGYYILKDDKINISFDLNISDSKKVFIAEGIFDGMSFGTVNQNYISLNSANNINNLKELINELENIYQFEYILALDNDQAGNKALEEISAFFHAKKINFNVFDLKDFNDPNEFLINDRKLFEKEIMKVLNNNSIEREVYLMKNILEEKTTKELVEKGYDVYASINDEKTYLKIMNQDGDWCYVQYEYFGGFNMSSVIKPSYDYGTGYRYITGGNFTIDAVDATLKFSKERINSGIVKKYDINEDTYFMENTKKLSIEDFAEKDSKKNLENEEKNMETNNEKEIKILQGKVISATKFPISGRDDAETLSFWIESNNGKKFNCQKWLNKNTEERELAVGDRVKVEGEFADFKAKDGKDKFNFKVKELTYLDEKKLVKLAGKVSSVNEFPIKDREDLINKSFWLEAENGKKYNCQKVVDLTRDDLEINIGDEIKIEGEFKNYQDKAGNERYNFKVYKLDPSNYLVSENENER